MVKRAVRAVYARLPFKRQVYVFLRRRLGLCPAFYEHLHFSGQFDLPIGGGRQVRLLSTGNSVENDLFWRGFGNGWEGTSLQLWRRICERTNGIALDIGANSGVYALVAASIGRSDVIAFEPLARVAKLLRRNIELNRLPIRVEQAAVSNHDGTAVIYDGTDAYNYSASLEGQGPGARAVDVPVHAIDTLLASRQQPVTAVKVDVERHEAAAIEGMKKIIAADRPAILIEILDREIGAAVEAHIAGAGYRMFHVLEGKGIVETDQLQPLEGHDWNHLLCTDELFRALELSDFLACQAPVSGGRTSAA